MKKHIHDFRAGRGSVDICECGRFRHNEKAGPAIVEQQVTASTDSAAIADFIDPQGTLRRHGLLIVSIVKD